MSRSVEAVAPTFHFSIFPFSPALFLLLSDTLSSLSASLCLFSLSLSLALSLPLPLPLALGRLLAGHENAADQMVCPSVRRLAPLCTL